MNNQEQKKRAYEWIMSNWDRGDFSPMDTHLSDSYVFRSSGQEDLNSEAFKDFVQNIHSGFPDYNIDILSQYTADDVVITKGISRGTHTVEFNGIAPTLKSINIDWVMYTHFEGSMIIEDWEIYDALGLLTQLGVFPS